MAAHLKTIWPRKCIRCGKPATKTLFSTQNEEIADYCTAHGQLGLNDYKRTEAS